MLNKKVLRNGTYTEIKYQMARKHKILSFFLVIFGIIVCTFWFMAVSKFWQIKHIEINDLTSLGREEVVKEVFQILDKNDKFILKGRNIFFLNPRELEKKLNERLFAESVVVDKSYPDILRLIIKERQRSVIIASKDQLLTVDINGLVTGEAVSSTTEELRFRLNEKSWSDLNSPPLIWCDLQELATSGYQIAKPEIVKVWLDAYKTLLTNNLKFRYVRMDETQSRTFKTRLENGIDLLVDIQTPLEPQIETYLKYQQSKLKNQPKEYIDVRIPGKLYLK